jgi:Domain of unknown function (DUF4440)
MRRMALVISLLAFNSAIVCAQAGTSLAVQRVDAKTRTELEKARETIWRAWFAGDSVALERLIPNALAAGSPWGWEERAATFASARRSAANGRLAEIRFDSTTITLRDSVAIMQARFTYVLELTNGRRISTRGIATEIFVRQDGHWVNPFWYLQ